MCECCGLSAMKKWNAIKVAWLQCLTVCCTKYELSQMPKRTIILLVAGLDGAGKSAIVNYLFNKSYLPKSQTVPTIGFRTVTFKYKKRLTIRLYDVGGSAQIRELWKKYYEEVHGVIYVVDASDGQRLFESAKVFQELACHDFITEKPILLLGNKQDKRITMSRQNLVEFMNLWQVSKYSKCFTKIEVCTCFKDEQTKFNFNKNIDSGFEWLVKMIDYNYETYEKEAKERKEKRKALRKSSTRSCRAEIEKYQNPFDYSDTDSETYGKPIVPNEELLEDQRAARKKKRKPLKNLFKKSRNKTAPITSEDLPLPTKKEMQELMKSITLEDLIKNTQVQEQAILAYRRPRRWKKKRPSTAPSKIEKPQPEVEVHASQEGNREETVVQINQQSSREKTAVQSNQQGSREETAVQSNTVNKIEVAPVESNSKENKNDTGTEVIEEIE